MRTKIIKIVILLFSIFLIYSLIEPYWIKTNVIHLDNSEVPSNFKGKKIVFVSDIHESIYFSHNRVEDLVSRIDSLDPDIVIFGGDYYWLNPDYAFDCFRVLENVKAKIGKFAVLGNHDFDHNQESSIESAIQDAGITDLDNKSEWILSGDQKIKIGGIGDLKETSQDLRPTISDVNKDDFVILVSHEPDYAEQLGTKKIDLMLSGHTHGGQLTFFGLWAPYIPSEYGQKYRTGIVKNDFTETIITNGVGTVLVPMRFFARPEITEIIL